MLSDSEKRKIYDQLGEEGLKGGMGGMGGGAGAHFTATNPEELFARVGTSYFLSGSLLLIIPLHDQYCTSVLFFCCC